MLPAEGVERVAEELRDDGGQQEKRGGGRDEHHAQTCPSVGQERARSANDSYDRERRCQTPRDEDRGCGEGHWDDVSDAHEAAELAVVEEQRYQPHRIYGECRAEHPREACKFVITVEDAHAQPKCTRIEECLATRQTYETKATTRDDLDPRGGLARAQRKQCDEGDEQSECQVS